MIMKTIKAASRVGNQERQVRYEMLKLNILPENDELDGGELSKNWL